MGWDERDRMDATQIASITRSPTYLYYDCNNIFRNDQKTKLTARRGGITQPGHRPLFQTRSSCLEPQLGGAVLISFQVFQNRVATFRLMIFDQVAEALNLMS